MRRRMLSALLFVGLTGTLIAQAPTAPAPQPMSGHVSFASREKLADGTLRFTDFSITVGGVTITGTEGIAIPGGFQFTGTTTVKIAGR